MQKDHKRSVRLPKHISPKEYFILLTPDLEAHTFSGDIAIDIQITESTKEIILHSKDLEIISYHIKKGKKDFPIKKLVYNDKKETITLVTKDLLPKGNYTLHFIFRGILSDTMRGFYKSTYTVHGKEHVIATTQFEATDARRAIPCFDEPAQKAIFHVKVVVPTHKTIISNTIETNIVEHESGVKIVSFAPTPKMSTYLLAFIVGDFEYIEKKTKRGVLVRVFTVPGKKEEGRFALDVAVRCIDFYEKYFDIQYPLPVLDMIAIPDFESFAMENWGAVTYRELALLVKEGETSLRAKQVVAIVVAHELAHQWFGNLVTMEWWTHLWLNEGFASYIEYLAVDHLFPEWNMWERFIVGDHNVALSLDALSNTHPIEVEVHHPGEISEIFDKISYSKGASVIRMLAEYIGEQDFRDGLRYYLKKHSYKNTETVHLWEAFEKISKKPIRKMMHTWTTQSGFPLITISEKKGVVSLSQERFTLSGKTSQENWLVPVTIDTDRKKGNTILLKNKKTTVHTPEGAYLNVNPNEKSFHITLLDQELKERFLVQIKNKRVGSIDRLGFIRDMHFLFISGKVKGEVLLDTLKAYTGESEYVVWVEIASVIASLDSILYQTKEYEVFKKFVIDLTLPTYEKLGTSKDNHDTYGDTLLRPLILTLLGKYGFSQIVSVAKRLFKNQHKDVIDPNLRTFVYVTVARHGDVADYKKLTSLYHKSDVHEEKNRILGALCHFPQKILVKETLVFIKKSVRLQDRFWGYGVLLGSYKTQHVCFEYIKKNWKDLVSSYGETSHQLSRIIESMDSFREEKDLKDIIVFFKDKTHPSMSRTLKQTIEKISYTLRTRKTQEKSIRAWLQKIK